MISDLQFRRQPTAFQQIAAAWLVTALLLAGLGLVLLRAQDGGRPVVDAISSLPPQNRPVFMQRHALEQSHLESWDSAMAHDQTARSRIKSWPQRDEDESEEC